MCAKLEKKNEIYLVPIYSVEIYIFYIIDETNQKNKNYFQIKKKCRFHLHVLHSAIFQVFELESCHCGLVGRLIKAGSIAMCIRVRWCDKRRSSK